ncbi:hypothetical protein IKF30_01825 [Candidatus Saccharibacteria bacterium]|nr:hypothetical protein [Candidatus Saccharibacteria bacterium]
MSRRRSKKWISRLIIFVLLIVACIIIYLVWDNYFDDKKDEGGEGEPELSIQEGGGNATEDSEDDTQEEDDKKVKQYEGGDPNNAEELSGAVTYAGVVGDVVMIRMNIDQYLGEGQCKLSLLNNATVAYEDTASIVSSASTATCDGFDVPVSKLSGGNYDIVIKIEASDKTGSITGEVAL